MMDIKEILKNDYNRKDYLRFLENKLLTDDFIKNEIEIDFVNKYKYINSATELGFDKKLNLRILEIIYNSDKDPRTSITRESFKIMEQKRYENALVFFIPKDTKEHYRFSFITSDLEVNDKGSIVKKFSNPKRYSFLLGMDSKIVTPYQEFFNKEKLKTIKDVQDRFSVEPVTKEFFKKYKEIFEKFNEYSYKNYQSYEFLHIQDDKKTGEKKIRDFNKKLLGRLVFLMFLQKKGWLNASNKDYKDGDKNFLSNFYYKAIKEGKVFYNEFLEPLFYDTLNKDRKEDVFSITNKKMPFLNGGLFEKEKGENSLFYPNELFTLLFDEKNGLFNQFNFTIVENDILDQEIAVDPEMLGHIFENLLEDNKDKGAFYTPKEIVDYMSKSSLLEYLKVGFEKENDVLKELVFSPEIADFRVHFIKNNRDLLNMLLDNVKILDPAIGSGAFPMGMLQAIIRVKEVLNHDLNRGEAKRNIIENSIYGVDIESGAVDIARLRFWLSLVVDEDKPSPLPNLDFKIVVGNSLVSILKIGNLEEVIDLSELKSREDSGVKIEGIKAFEDLLKAKNDFYKEIKDKKELKEKIKTYEREILNIVFEKKIVKLDMLKRKPCTKNFDGKPKNYKKCEEYRIKKALLEQTLEDIKTKDYYIFDFYLNFNEVFQESNGFDIIIGNPPYGVSIKGEYRKNVLNLLGKVPDYEIYYYFYVLSHKLLTNNGILSFIVPNTFLFNTYANNYRLEMLKKWSLLEILDCSKFKVFESATVFNTITVLKKGTSNFIGYKNTSNAKSFEVLSQKEKIIIDKTSLISMNQNWSLVFLLNPKTIKIIKKIKKNNSLSSFFPQISQGLIAYDKYRGQSKEIIKNRAYHYDTYRKGLKKWLKGADIIKYKVIWNNNKYIDYCNGIANPREPKFFKNTRILIREITNPSIYASLTNKELYNDPSIIIILDDKKYSIKNILGILNSKLATFFHFNHSPKAIKGAFPKLLVGDIKDFPIPKITRQQQIPFETIVEQIINLKKENKDTQRLEDKIDLIVYKLYELIHDEIKIIDSDFDEVLKGFGIDWVKYEGMSIEEIYEMV